MRTPPPHPYWKTNPAVIKERADGALVIRYERMLLHKWVKVILDKQDLPTFLRRVWNVNYNGILESGMPPHKMYLHRIITGAPPGQGIRFANGNCLDLRRANILLKGRCRAVGKFAPCLYPRYQATGTKKIGRIVNGFRTVVRAGRLKFFREFSFQKYGMEGAAVRALQWRVGMLQAYGREVTPDLLEHLDSAKRILAAARKEVGHREDSEGRVVKREVKAFYDERMVA